MPSFALYRRGNQYGRHAIEGTSARVGQSGRSEIVLVERAIHGVEAVLTREPGGFRIVPAHEGGKVVVAGNFKLPKGVTGENVPGGLAVDCAILQDGAEVLFGETRAVYEEKTGNERTQIVQRTQRAPLGDQKPLPRMLYVIAKEAGGKEPPLIAPLPEELFVGSDGALSNFVVPDPLVSARHLRVGRLGNTLVVQDKQSTNGTWFGAIRVHEIELPLLTRVRMGGWDLWVSENPELEAELRHRNVLDFEGFLAESPVTRDLCARAGRVAADGRLYVLIEGESGTGKDVLANAIHRSSPRANGPFVPINCGEMTAEMMANELFGHEKGAYTGAVQASKGAFVAANGGTLFLDEIGEMAIELQPRLLRTTDKGKVRPVGSAIEVDVDARLICATNRILINEVEAGRFREDLYYRLNVAHLRIPPLRQRKGDIAILWDYAVRRLRTGMAMVPTSYQALRKIEDYDWPGNIREVQTAAYRALRSLEPGEKTIDERHIEFDLRPAKTSPTANLLDPVGRTLAETERAAILATLRHFEGNKSRTAAALGIARKTLREKLKPIAAEAKADLDRLTDDDDD